MSNASDLGYRALADVAGAGIDTSSYRIVGGHMVQLLLHAYPTPEARERSTADADAGIKHTTAVGQDLHKHLLAQGYRDTRGNQYVRKDGQGGEMIIDLLVPHDSVGKVETQIINGRGFDAIPGLSFALSQDPLLVEVKVLLLGGDDLTFTVPVPDVEAALILKALAWRYRSTDKDLMDLTSLLEIVRRHKESLSSWEFSDSRRGTSGHRKDAARALHMLRDRLDRGLVRAGAAVAKPARLAALIKENIPAVG
ncbi:hypothetical protein [Paenarthrobacter aromaticivorans]|uniref:Uncharacterized protein n=1 Tax=Paenarthrobacter aromaticivorans TaxID=2849150 RepID=A0ABS6HZG5_9MICC|nr:hypothetical protein [Paenarthrobacter sp. MMS21-TAE1-1]MBU8864896.1 hypothetical protein [Paenarthrobacter sp. MMS21-TAE1-1]